MTPSSVPAGTEPPPALRLAVAGFDAALFDRFAFVLGQMERGRSALIREALDALIERHPERDELWWLGLAFSFARGGEALPAAISAFRTRQDADPLAARFRLSERVMDDREGSPPPAAEWKGAGEGTYGAVASGAYTSVWKLGGGWHLLERELPEAGPVVVVEGLVKKHLGDDDACVLEVCSFDRTTRVVVGEAFVNLDGDAQAVRVGMHPRFVSFRLAVLPEESWLFVDGVGAVRSTHAARLPVRSVRFGVVQGSRAIDANSFWSCLRVLWNADGIPGAADLAPSRRLDEHLSNAAAAWLAAGQRHRALGALVTAAELRPSPVVLDNLARLAAMLGEDLDPFNPRLVHALGLAGVDVEHAESDAAAAPLPPASPADDDDGLLAPAPERESPLRALGLGADALVRLREVIAHLDAERFEPARAALLKLSEAHPEYHAFRHLLVASLAGLGQDAAAIALFRDLQGEGALGHRLHHTRSWMSAQGGPVPTGGTVIETAPSGAEATPDALMVWKQGTGSRLFEIPLAGDGTVVFEGLVRRTAGDDESCVVEVDWGHTRERVVLNTGFLSLKSSGQAVRLRPPTRYAAFRVAVHAGQSRLYVDGSMMLQSAGLPVEPPRALRFGVLSGLAGTDTGTLWSSLRLGWDARPRVAHRHLAPFPRYAEHLSNLALAWLELGSRDRAFHCMAAAIETDARQAVIANFEALVSRLAGELDPEDERMQRCLGIVKARAGADRAHRLGTIIRQRRHQVAVSCRGVSIYFARAPHRISHPFEIAKRLVNPRRYFEKNYWWAVRDVSFDLRYGEVLAVVGNNGAGKSTLLRAIAGILDHEGSIVVNGDSRLLVMGLGIQEELTGRENVTLGCLYLGLRRRQISARTEEILEFAELLAFADTPYKYYSDGMKARLMFSIATSIEPDILLLDELLGAGDVSFRNKALARMNHLLDRSKAMIVVTHNLTFVRERARKALYLDKGQVIYYGAPHKAIDLYLERTGRGPGALRQDSYLLEEV